MRILFLTHQYLHRHIGGTEVLVHQLAKRALREGHEVRVITHVEAPPHQHGEWRVAHCAFEGVAVTEVHSNLSSNPHVARAEYDQPGMAERIAEIAVEFRADVVHVAHLLAMGATVLRALKRRGLRVVLTLSDFWLFCMRHTLMKPDGQICQGPDGRECCVSCARATHGMALSPRGSADYEADVEAIAARAGFIRDAVLLVDEIVAFSEFLKWMLVKQGWPEARIRVIRPGIAPDALEAGRKLRRGSAPPSGEPLVLSVATITPHKGQHVLAEALRRLPEWRGRVRVVGGVGSDPAY